MFWSQSLVVLYLHSTSNHNYWSLSAYLLALYYIFILHQTTTALFATLAPLWLYYIFILHQTTTYRCWCCYCRCCIISSFYIKPQPLASYRQRTCSCIISSFYIKPQRKRTYSCYFAGCIISSFYIKPQRSISSIRDSFVVLYLHSTSNHNCNVVILPPS